MALAVARFLLRDIQLPEGGFATALDASTDGVEGATYLWTRQQVEDVLGPAETERFLAVYALTPLPEQRGGAAGEPPAGVLRLRLPMVDTLARTGAADPAALIASVALPRGKLFAARDARPQPGPRRQGGQRLERSRDRRPGRGGPDLQGAPAHSRGRQGGGSDLGPTPAIPRAAPSRDQMFEGKGAVDGTPEDYAALGVGYLDLGRGPRATRAGRDGRRSSPISMLQRFLQPDGRLQAGAGLLPVALGDNEDADLPSGTASALALLGRLATAPDGRALRRRAGQDGDAARRHDRSASRDLAERRRGAGRASAEPGGARRRDAEADQGGLSATPAEPHAPATSDHVRASVAMDGDTVAVTLDVDPGYHNQRPRDVAGLPRPDRPRLYRRLAAGAVAYPTARSFQPAFSKAPLAVYEGEVTLTATLPKGAAGWHAGVTAQACDAHTCLPPSTLAVARPRRKAGRLIIRRRRP